MSIIRRFQPILVLVVWLASVAGLVVGIGSERLIGTPIVAVGSGAVGVFLGFRRVGTRIAWLLLAMASSATPALFMVIPVEIQNGVVIAGLAILLVVFPTGTPRSRIWLIPMGLVVVGWVFIVPLGEVAVAGFGVPIGVAVGAVSIVWCAAAPIARFRGSVGVERAQMRWLVTVVSVGSLGVLLVGAGVGLASEPLFGLGGLLVLLGFGLGIPVAIVVAVTRHRLYDLDRIVSRTVTYAIVASAIAGTFALIVLSASALTEGSGPIATAVAVLAARGLTSPVHRRVRRFVDHRFNRSAYDAAREVEDLTTWVQTNTELPVVVGRLGEVAARLYQPHRVAVWVAAAQARSPGSG